RDLLQVSSFASSLRGSGRIASVQIKDIGPDSDPLRSHPLQLHHPAWPQCEGIQMKASPAAPKVEPIPQPAAPAPVPLTEPAPAPRVSTVSTRPQKGLSARS